MSKKSKKVDPFFAAIGKELGVDPSEIRLKNTEVSQNLICLGPKPKLKFENANWPWPILDEYCFTLVLEYPIPNELCLAWREEYEFLHESLQSLIQQEAWEYVAEVAQRLAELRQGIDRCARPGTRTVRYCIFPPQRT